MVQLCFSVCAFALFFGTDSLQNYQYESAFCIQIVYQSITYVSAGENIFSFPSTLNIKTLPCFATAIQSCFTHFGKLDVVHSWLSHVRISFDFVPYNVSVKVWSKFKVSNFHIKEIFIDPSVFRIFVDWWKNIFIIIYKTCLCTPISLKHLPDVPNYSCQCEMATFGVERFTY